MLNPARKRGFKSYTVTTIFLIFFSAFTRQNDLVYCCDIVLVMTSRSILSRSLYFIFILDVKVKSNTVSSSRLKDVKLMIISILMVENNVYYNSAKFFVIIFLC